jgi:hypothetical protein
MKKLTYVSILRLCSGRISFALQIVGHELTLALDRHQAALLEVVAECLKYMARLFGHLSAKFHSSLITVVIVYILAELSILLACLKCCNVA